ncbi:MAG: permease [Nitrospirales bacterium]|nr:MAG: permease [Nitrospirales bacterium]
MNKRVTEEVILLINVAKWLVLATGVGLLVGLSTTFFLKALEMMIAETTRIPYSLFLLPIGLSVSAWITSSLAPEAGGQGVERVIQAVHLRSGRIKAQVIPAKLIATLLTIGTGGSAGNVGPCAQIGGAVASWAAEIFRFSDDDRKTLVICGISAGFASVLGTPIAGAFFGVEALFVGALAYQVLLPSVIAAVVGHQVTLFFGISFWTSSVEISVLFSSPLLLWSILAGVYFGLCALLLIEGINLGKRVAFLSHFRPPLLAFLGGLAILGIASIFSMSALGLGDRVIQEALAGQAVLWYVFMLKIILTSLTLNFGGSGGVILPICFVGATAGSIFGNLFALDSGVFAALGIAGLLAGAVNTPITAVLLSLELFGVQIGACAMVCCAVSFLISGHRSAIPTQLLQLHKAPGIRADLNQEVSETQFFVDAWEVRVKVVREKIKNRLIIMTKRSKPKP